MHPSDSLSTALRQALPVDWFNPQWTHTLARTGDLGMAQIAQAAARLHRFAPLLLQCFPELQASAGVVDSPLLPVPALAQRLDWPGDAGQLWLKADHLLPVAGSIKARGGMHEVLEFAENLALELGLLTSVDADHGLLCGAPARAAFSRYRVAVGSTGNLGLSIGVVAAALGFSAQVHMSAEAKAWKKQRLQNRGVQVIEHQGDYEQAVAAGRAAAASDPRCHFVDDERSVSLLLGYAVAALHLQKQLAQQGRAVDAENPLFVYVPCGVGGAPAGIALGLREVFGAAAHCFFAEPVQSPCFLLQMLAAPGQHPSVYDWGLSNQTEADGLAVPRASLLAAALMRQRLSGVFTVQDADLLRHLVQVLEATGERIEPSAAAGLEAARRLVSGAPGRAWLQQQGLLAGLPRATHVVWTTGGLFVPPEEFAAFAQRGRALLQGG